VLGRVAAGSFVPLAPLTSQQHSMAGPESARAGPHAAGGSREDGSVEPLGGAADFRILIAAAVSGGGPASGGPPPGPGVASRRAPSDLPEAAAATVRACVRVVAVALGFPVGVGADSIETRRGMEGGTLHHRAVMGQAAALLDRVFACVGAERIAVL
jgi:hypothetical protein